MNWISNARIVAIFSVVCLHIAAYAVLNAELGTANWWSGNFYDAATRWCVPDRIVVQVGKHLPQSSGIGQHRDASEDELLAQLWPKQFIGDGTLNACLMAVRRAIGRPSPPPRKSRRRSNRRRASAR